MSMMTKATALLALMTMATGLPAEEAGLAAGAVKTPEGKDWQIPADKENFHIFTLMGQSNMAGEIPGKYLTDEDKTPVPHVVLLRGKEWIR